jgi:hypothetical protein
MVIAFHLVSYTMPTGCTVWVGKRSVLSKLELARQESAEGLGSNLINVRGCLISSIRLPDHFHLGGEPPAIK